MRTHRRKIFADVFSRRGRTLLVSLSIMMGVIGVVALVGMSDLINRQIIEDTPPETVAMNKLLVGLPFGRLTLEQNRELLRQIEAEAPGVVRAEGQALYQAGWRRADAPADTPYRTINLASFTEDFDAMTIEGINRLMDGRYPEAGQHEVVVDFRFLEKYGVAVGDEIVFQAVGAGDTEQETWTIVGTVYHAYFLLTSSLTENIYHNDMMYAHYADAQEIVGFGGLTMIFARFEDFEQAKTLSNELNNYITSRTPYVPIFNLPEDPHNTLLYNQVSSVTDVLTSLAFIAMLVSGFLVVNVINTIVVEQKKQIGVLKSLGATRFDTFIIYAGIAFVYGVIGTTLGLIIGMVVTTPMAQTIAEVAFTHVPDDAFSQRSIIAGATLGLLVPVLVAIIPVYNGTRVSILNAMVDLGISSNWGSSGISQWVKRLPLPVTIRQAISNVLMKSGRLALTGFTLMLAVAAFMGVFAVQGSLASEVDRFFGANYQILIGMQEIQPVDELHSAITSVDGIKAVYPGFNVAVRLENYIAPESDVLFSGTDAIFATGVDPEHDVIGYEFLSGGAWQGDEDGVILSRVLANETGLGVGDTISVGMSDTFQEFDIIGVQNFGLGAIYMRWDSLAKMAGFADSSGAPSPNSYYVEMDNANATAEQVDEAIQAVDTALREQGIIIKLTNQVRSAEEQAQQIDVLAVTLNMTSVLMGLVGAIGLLATLSMAVFERQKEIGVMRSIGAGSGTIIIQFLTEGILVGIVSWLIAIPVSYVLGQGILSSLPFGDLQYSYPPLVISFGLVGIISVTMIASIWPSMAAARRTVSDILRYQ